MREKAVAKMYAAAMLAEIIFLAVFSAFVIIQLGLLGKGQDPYPTPSVTPVATLAPSSSSDASPTITLSPPPTPTPQPTPFVATETPSPTPAPLPTLSPTPTPVPGTNSVFQETGLPAGTQWSLLCNGITQTVYAPSPISYSLTAGTPYGYVTIPTTGYTASPSGGVIYGGTTVTITYTSISGVTPTPVQTRTPTPLPTPIATPTPTSSPTPTPTSSPTPTPSPTHTPTPSPSPTPSSPNLAVIPDAWSPLLYGSGPQIAVFDYSVTHNGNPSIRIDPHTDADVNTVREADRTMISGVRAGDHIVAKIWIKTGSSQLGYNGNHWYGGRMGIDFYGANGFINGVSGAHGTLPQPDADTMAMYVPWGSDWTQRTIDMVVPATMPRWDTGNPDVPMTFIFWLQASPANEPASAWFADAEVYISPWKA